MVWQGREEEKEIRYGSKNKEREREVDRQTDRQTDREREREREGESEKERGTDRQRERERESKVLYCNFFRFATRMTLCQCSKQQHGQCRFLICFLGEMVYLS